MTVTSELAHYYQHNPDPSGPTGCRNTGKPEDGVVFPGVEPRLGFYTFIGRTSVIEAVAVLFDVPVNQVAERLLEGTTDKRRIRELSKELAAARKTLDSYKAFEQSALDAGFLLALPK